MRYRTIGVVTVGRSDYGIYLPILRQIRADSGLQLHLFVSGAHLVAGSGSTVEMILNDGFDIAAQVNMLLASDSPASIAKSIGVGISGWADAFARYRPDLLLVLGDRFEMFAAAAAALPFKIPVAHIHGGELTYGAIDDALRHCLTKLSHLHFVSTEAYARRVKQLGEEPWRVTVSGAPSLDNLEMELLTRNELEAQFGFPLDPGLLLITFHPVTLEFEQAGWQIGELLAAIDVERRPALFTMPNMDTRNSIIRRHIEEYVRSRPLAWSLENLGTRHYFSMMQFASVMVGNSSSGIIEAPSFKLPVVNIGTRQAGRVRAANVLDVGYRREEISKGIKRATSAEFRTKLNDLQNPYRAERCAAAIIVERIKAVSLDDALIQKAFYDFPPGERERIH